MPLQKLSKLFLSLFVIFNLSFVIYSSALAEEYDGIWFLGFNFNKQICTDKNFRDVIANSIDVKKISKDIMEANLVPQGIVPPGMLGYEKEFSINNFQLTIEELSKYKNKKIVLLHTNGVKTKKVAKQIKEDLKSIGINLVLKEIDYAKGDSWEEALQKGFFHLYLMGYKAQNDDILTPLFSSNGGVNFSNFKSSKVDTFLKAKKYKEANRLLSDIRAAVVLMYITKL